MNKRRGRPAGGSDARLRILAAAREAFLERGYAAATLRDIARAADVDVALISYHFGSKQQLFGAAVSLTVSPGTVLSTLLQGGSAQLAGRILRAVLSTWDAPDVGGPLTLLLAETQRDARAMRSLREYLDRELGARLAAHIGGIGAGERAAAALTITMGLIVNRYVLRLEPIASMSAEQVARSLEPAMNAALWRGRLPNRTAR
ncbi:MAG TPA: TetR family transcriptional regulator [Blastococcus sp.]|jgi:AcrR family transcriptional regulator|nr:TetR family transcriptional regulator [Blastococcus sp.]